MKTFLQILTSSLFIFGSSLASANDSGARHPSQGEIKATKSDQMKSKTRKIASSKKNQQLLAESSYEGDRPFTQKEIDEMKEILGEK